MPNKIILASTFRHYFLGIGLALQDSRCSYHLIFIDQAFDDSRNTTMQAAKQILTPFISVTCLPARSTEAQNSKRKNRQKGFQILKKMINELNPIEICTGNDRRIEFQYAMQHSKKNTTEVTGSYIEDGTGSYIHKRDFDPTKYRADRYIDTFFKKLAYGLWYSHPYILGGGKWIKTAYLTFPKQTIYPDRIKRVQLDRCIFELNNTQQILRSILNLLDTSPINKEDSATLLVLPHSSLIKNIYGSNQAFRAQITKLVKNSKNTYVKYHPRDLDDPLHLSPIATLLPTMVPVEMYLLTLNITMVIGDISTAMLSAKWLKPNCQVQFIKSASKYSKTSETLFKKLGITELIL